MQGGSIIHLYLRCCVIAEHLMMLRTLANLLNQGLACKGYHKYTFILLEMSREKNFFIGVHLILL